MELVKEEFKIKESLKNHYLFEYPINQLIDTFIIIFKTEKKELLRKFEKRLDSLYGELSFSSTVFNISDMIVFKYLNDNLTFDEKCFIKSSKFKEYPFQVKIKELEERSN